MVADFDMKLINKLLNRYQQADKKRKGEILAEYCRLTGVKRNTACKRFRAKINNVYPRIFPNKKYQIKKRGPKKKYTAVHQRIIKQCWRLSGHVCAERLHPMLSVYLDQLKKNDQLKTWSPAAIRQTKKVSLGTLKNILIDLPNMGAFANRKKGKSFIYQQVPVMAHFGQFAHHKPGYVEVDFVEHNGGVSSGSFVVTAMYTDIFSQWVSRACSLGKNLSSMEKTYRIAESKIYHQINHYHPDNDRAILKLLWEKAKGLKEKGESAFSLSRSRPYQKNDNAHVEQKNGDKIRRLVGYCRYDSQQEVVLLNKLYKKADLLDNFFIASAKIKEKIRDNQGRVIKRKHDVPQTPYQRLRENKDTSLEVKNKLKKIYLSLNMIKLRQETEDILQELFTIQEEKYRQKGVLKIK